MSTSKAHDKNMQHIQGYFGGIGLSLANASDITLKFNEIICMHSFQSAKSMSKIILKKYQHQSTKQFYKIIGSSDLLGNPVGWVEDVSRGLFEFVKEPSQGMLKGPKEFIKGIGRGAKSLVHGVVGGSAKSINKITGSLYGFMKSIGGEAEAKSNLAQPKNVITGIGYGIKGGISEIASGVTGICTKPYKGAKQQGLKGFFKGAGKGVVGALTTPFTAILRVQNSVSLGLASTARFRIPEKGRFRFPRYFGPKKIVEVYSEEHSAAYESLFSIEQGQFHKERLIASFNLDRHLLGNKFQQNVIFSNKKVFLIEEYKDLIQGMNFKHIDYLQLNVKGKNNFYLAMFDRKRNITFIIESTYDILYSIYEYIYNQPFVQIKGEQIDESQIQIFERRRCLRQCMKQLNSQ